MILPLLLSLTALPPCQSWRPEQAAVPDRARWIEAEGIREGRWLGWGPAGPRRGEAPTQGPWLAIEFEVPSIPTPAEGWLLELSNGSVLRGGPGPDVPDLGTPSWFLGGAGAPALPIDPVFLSRQGRGRLPARLGASEDQVWLRRARGVLDLQQGYLLDWNSKGLTFQALAGERNYPWAEVDSFCLLEESPAPQADAVWLTLADGSFLSARILEQDPQNAGNTDFLLELPWRGRVRIPAQGVARIVRRAGVEEWAGAEWEVRASPPQLVVDWSPKVNRAVDGGFLRLGTRIHPIGLGTRAPTELARPASGAGLLFVTLGVDAAVSDFRQPQPVVFSVLLDDQILTATPALSAVDGGRALLVRVPRAGMLRLRAEAAGQSVPGAHANWCDLIWLPGE
jgi:hypothetical protein